MGGRRWEGGGRRSEVGVRRWIGHIQTSGPSNPRERVVIRGSVGVLAVLVGANACLVVPNQDCVDVNGSLVNAHGLSVGDNYSLEDALENCEVGDLRRKT